MPTLAAHRVRRMRWQARVATPGAALELRSTLLSEADRIEAMLDEAVAQVALGFGPDTVIRLPRLELRIRTDDATGLVDELRRTLADRLQAALREQGSKGGMHAVEFESHARAELIEYLGSGLLPWRLGHLPHAACLAALREAALRLLREDEPPAIFADRDARSRIAPLRRWLALLPEGHGAELLERLAAHDATALADARAGLGDAAGAAGAERLDLQAQAMAWPASGLTSDAGIATAIAADAPGSITQQPLKLDIQGKAPTPAHVDATTDIDWLVPHAGLVLLHPYLPRLFAALDIAAQTAPASLVPEKLPRAAALLHWLATGRDEAQEFELTLIRLLLGLPPDGPLAFAPPALSTDDRAEAEALLEAVRQHWPALRGSSIATLRESFLQRRGALIRQGGRWCLTPNRQAFDLLLSTLPWNLQWVRLPWMPAPLEVIWPTQ